VRNLQQLEQAQVAVIGVTGAPAVIVALGVGIFAQTVWNATGGADLAEDAMQSWLR
jgi:hypothetical protein